LAVDPDRDSESGGLGLEAVGVQVCDGITTIEAVEVRLLRIASGPLGRHAMERVRLRPRERARVVVPVAVVREPARVVALLAVEPLREILHPRTDRLQDL